MTKRFAILGLMAALALCAKGYEYNKRLDCYGYRYNIGPGWTFLCISKEKLE